MNVSRLPFLILLAAFMWAAGCATQKSVPDPLAGWNFCFSQDPAKLDQAIQTDYRDYVEKLPAEEKKNVGTIHTFEDGKGQHAISIEIFESKVNASWATCFFTTRRIRGLM